MLLLSNNLLLRSMKQSSNIDKQHWMFISQNWHFEIDFYAIVFSCLYSVQCSGIFVGVCANICSSEFADKGIDSNDMCRGKKIILALIKLIFISDLTTHVRVYDHKRKDLFFGSSYCEGKFFSSWKYKIVVTNNYKQIMTGDVRTAFAALAIFEDQSLLNGKYFNNTQEDNSKLCQDVECTCEQRYLL